MTNNALLNSSPLGKKVSYSEPYNPNLLYRIPRQLKRDALGVPSPLPFYGADVWNAFELSWLNSKGKPIVAVGEFIFPCDSPNLIEAKSLKIYLNSFNQTNFPSVEAVTETLIKDFSELAGMPVAVKVMPVERYPETHLARFDGQSLDKLDIECTTYHVEPQYLITESNNIVEEVLYSDLLKSNCLVTNQPDWGSVQIQYRGKKISHEGLLRYIVSFRECLELQEQCAEHIFMDIFRQCAPEMLTVVARYTRRGGLDTNAYRSTEKRILIPNDRLVRQ